MAIGVNYRTLVDIRPLGSETVVQENFTIPGPAAATILTFRLIELPLNVPIGVPAPTPPQPTDQIVVQDTSSLVFFNLVTAPTLPNAGEFQIDNTSTFGVGTIKFNQLDAARNVDIWITGRGSLVFAEDVNDPRDEQKAARDTETDLGTRLDLIEDGTRIEDEAIRARHITTIAEDFTFPAKVVVTGDLEVKGSFSDLQTETVKVFDNIIELNSNITGAPTENAGIEVNRGTSANSQFVWNETDDLWEMTEGGLRMTGGDLAMERKQVLKGVIHNVADAAAESTLVSEPALEGQLAWRVDLKKLRVFDGTSFQPLGAITSFTRDDQVAGAAQTLFTLTTITYTPASTRLLVYVDGLLQKVGASNDYVETSGTQVTFNTAPATGAAVSFIHFGT
jgi:hypothetical protein